MMKKCCCCNTEKDVEINFYKNSRHRDGYQSICKDCKRSKNKQYYLDDKSSYIEKARIHKQSVRLKIKEIKAKVGCKICQEKEPCCLDFHHPNDDKELTLGKASDFSWSKVEREIKKCIIVCKNCHAKIHAGLLRA